MKPGYNLMFPTFEDVNNIEKDYYKAEKRYVEKGYALPIHSLQLIKDMYNDQYRREMQESFNAGEDMSDVKSLRIDILQTLTRTKLLNESYNFFQNNPEDSFNLIFKNGVPDEKTSEFFNLTDGAGEYLNVSRTSSLRLPDSFFTDKPKEMDFSIFKDGEQIFATNNGQETVLQDTLDNNQ